MVDVVLRMKVAAVRRSFGGMQALGLAGGLLLAWQAFALGVFTEEPPSEAASLFASAFGGWVLIWIVVPLLFGRDPLRPEYFALLPISPRRLGLALLAATFISVLALVTLLGFLGLAAYAFRLGVAETVVAVVAIPLLLAFVIVLSKVLVGILGEGMKSRIGRE